MFSQSKWHSLQNSNSALQIPIHIETTSNTEAMMEICDSEHSPIQMMSPLSVNKVRDIRHDPLQSAYDSSVAQLLQIFDHLLVAVRLWFVVVFGGRALPQSHQVVGVSPLDVAVAGASMSSHALHKVRVQGHRISCKKQSMSIKYTIIHLNTTFM